MLIFLPARRNQACASVGGGAFEEGKQLHAEIVKKGVQDDVVVGGSLVNMYAKCGSLEHARKLFDSLAEKNVVAWNAMVAGYAQQGMGQQALDLYTSMQKAGLCANSVTYVSLLQACACVGEGAFAKGKELHAQIQERGLERDVVVGGSLVNMYAKCGRLKEARIEFDKLQNKDVVTWTAIIAGYAEQGMGEEALGLHRGMQQEGLYPNSVTYVCLLQACATIGLPALVQGKELHASIKARGLQEDVCLGGSLVNMYAKCGSLEDAQRMFSELSERSVVAWNAMIGAYAQRGMGQKSLSLYRSMQLESLTLPNCVTYICLLQACASVGVSALDEGKQLHAEIKQQGLQEDPVVGGSLVNMYAKCGSLHDAHRLFDTLTEKSVVAWNAMIAGYAQQGFSEEAFSLHRCMQQDGLTSPNSVTYVCLLQACASVGVDALDEGKQLHAHITQRGLQDDGSLQVSLVNMYAKCCSLEDARSLFDKLPDKNVVAWNAMIAGYSQQGMGQEALRLYSSMRLEGFTADCFTYVSLLQACASVGIGALSEGKQFHVQIKELGLEEDVVLGSSLVNMHARCGNLEDARSVFEKLPERSTAAWNAIISGYAHQGMGEDALNLYRCMQERGLTPDSVTFVSLLLACASIGSEALEEGKQLHTQIEKLGPQEELALGVSLVNMYGKCGSIEEARKVFDKLAERNLVTWNAMIAGYAQQGMCEDALSLYTQMQQEGITPDSVTYVCLLQACAAVAAFSLGKQLHVEIDERGEQVDGIVGASLVNMYAKCGSMFDSQRVFDSLSEKSNEVYSALIGGYARQGDSQAVFDLLDRMKLDHIFPDEITFLSVLTVCSHVGLIDEGRKYFEAMRTDYGLSATMEHYICMVDLLGRAGHLDEALQIVKTMPYPPNNVLWLTLLSASRKWNNVEIAQQAFEGALRVGSRDSTSM